MESTKEFNLAVGLRIREAREALKMTREHFAEKCGISASFLASVENGNKAPTTKTLYKICTAANISPNYILNGSGEGYAADIMLEIFQTMNSDARDHAVRILKEYVDALDESSRKNK